MDALQIAALLETESGVEFNDARVDQVGTVWAFTANMVDRTGCPVSLGFVVTPGNWREITKAVGRTVCS